MAHVEFTALWLPILLSAVFVFLLSWIIHMFLPYHRSDYGKLPKEDEVADALRAFAIPRGDYMLPCGGGAESMKDPKFLERLKKGPVLTMTVMKPGMFDMGPTLMQWFFYCALLSVFSAYVAGRALAPGASYLEVFRFAGVTAFASYALGGWQNSIWYQKSWATTMKNTFDGLLYGLVTAGTFGWLWPK